MPMRIKLARQRLVLAKLALAMVRAVAVEYLGEENFGSCADDVLLLIAIYIGQAESKPMTANKLAAYVGMPRATVIRKLREMKSASVVEMNGDGTAALVIEKLNDDRMVGAINSAVQAVHRSSTELSKMDRQPVAARYPK